METATSVMVMKMMAVVPVSPIMDAPPSMPPMRPISPVPRRVPAYPIWTPKPVIYHRSVDIYRFDDIVGSIYILIADNLHGHLGDRSWVLNGAFIMAHDHCRALRTDTYIGSDCVIGVNAIIMPGVHIGNEVVIGSGAIVTKDIPSNCIAAGNPAKVLKTNIHVYNGQLK